MYKIFIIGLFSLLGTSMVAQDFSEIFPSGTFYGIKGGMTIATQRWNGFDRQALPSYHADFSIESAGDWKERKVRSLFGAQLGYHRRGSAVRVQYYDPANPQNVYRELLAYPFHNLSLVLTGKGQHVLSEKLLAQYNLGLRADYTLAYSSPFINFERFTNKFNYGLWFGGGLQIPLKKSPVNLIVELNISPDLSRQIYVPAGIPIQYLDFGGSVQSFPSQEQRVYNMCFEVSVGFVFVKKREYYVEEEY